MRHRLEYAPVWLIVKMLGALPRSLSRAVAIGLAAVAARNGASGANVASAFFLAGIVLFSGSLYLLAVTGVRTLGLVTPFGGLAFLVGWAALAWAATKLA